MAFNYFLKLEGLREIEVEALGWGDRGSRSPQAGNSSKGSSIVFTDILITKKVDELSALFALWLAHGSVQINKRYVTTTNAILTAWRPGAESWYIRTKLTNVYPESIQSSGSSEAVRFVFKDATFDFHDTAPPQLKPAPPKK